MNPSPGALSLNTAGAKPQIPIFLASGSANVSGERDMTHDTYIWCFWHAARKNVLAQKSSSLKLNTAYIAIDYKSTVFIV